MSWASLAAQPCSLKHGVCVHMVKAKAVGWQTGEQPDLVAVT